MKNNAATLAWSDDTSGTLFSKQWNVLPPNLVKSRSGEIGCGNDCIALKFDRQLDSAAVEAHVKFQSDWKTPNSKLAASKFQEMLQ